jgi:hypothetical protein
VLEAKEEGGNPLIPPLPPPKLSVEEDALGPRLEVEGWSAARLAPMPETDVVLPAPMPGSADDVLSPEDAPTLEVSEEGTGRDAISYSSTVHEARFGCSRQV